ncbi:hypothetical protein [Streptacidiphilus sp. PAMC 29251]
MLLVQFLFCLALIAVLLFVEGLFFYPALRAGGHALERAPLGAAGIAMVVTGAHLVRVRRTRGPATAQLWSTQIMRFDPAATGSGVEAAGFIRSLAPEFEVRKIREGVWGVDLGTVLRWLTRITVTINQESLLLEIAPRQPLLFPGKPLGSRKIASLVTSIQGGYTARRI